MRISTYITTLKRLRKEYIKQDPGSLISDKAFAQRMLIRAGLARNTRHDVFHSAGGRYDPKTIEAVLRRRCAKAHHDDSKRGPAPVAKRMI